MKKWKISEAMWDKITDINGMMDAQAQCRYIDMIQQNEGTGYEETIALIQSTPKYSLGMKMCSPAVMIMLTKAKGRQRFREWLTPEELEIFDSEIEPMGLKSLMKKEMRRQKRE